MSLDLEGVTARLNGLGFNAQEKGQLKAKLMRLNSEQLDFLFYDDDVVTASLANMLDSNKGYNQNGPNLNNVNNVNINNLSLNNNNGAPKCRNFNTCQKYCYSNPNGGYYDYCGLTCRQNNSNNNRAPKCLNFNTCQQYCRSDGNGGYYDYCGLTCRQNNVVLWSSGPLSVLPQGTPKYLEIESQFINKWKHTHKSKPTIKTILLIDMDRNILKAYQNYQDKVESQGKFKGKAVNHGCKIMTEGNECRRFHGTAVQCQIGINGNTSLCQDPLCSVCQIIQNSFKIKNAGKNFGWSRFGKGIYFSATSSKSDDYVKTNNTTKVMFMAKVVIGKGYKLKQNAQISLLDLQNQGYHSVIGEVGAVLNHDEAVIYEEAAAIPSYLILLFINKK